MTKKAIPLIKSVRRGLYDTKRPTFERASVGYAPDGTIVPPHYPRFTPGNYAMKFDGGRYINVGNIRAFDTLDAITMEAWMRPTDSSGASAACSNTLIMGKRSAGGCSVASWGMGYSAHPTASSHDKRVVVITGGDSGSGTTWLTIRSNSQIPHHAWTHVCGVINRVSNTVSIFVNGLLDVIQEFVSIESFNNSHSLLLGRGAGSLFFRGILDEVRIWGADKSDDVEYLMNNKIHSAPGLIARWGFDEGHGDIAYDTAEPINLILQNQSDGGEDPNGEGFSGTSSATIESTTEQAHSGNRSYKVVPTSTGVSGAFASVNVKPNTKYTASCYFKSEPGARLRLYVQERAGTTTIGGSGPIETIESSDWQRFVVEHTTGDSATSFRIYMQTVSDMPTFYFDDLMLQEGELTSWVPGQGVFNGTIHGATYTDHTPYPPYGRSILVEEGTENLFLNPTLVNGASGWSKQSSSVENFDGYTRITVTTTFGGIRQQVARNEGGEYSLHLWVRHVAGTPYFGISITNVENQTILLDGEAVGTVASSTIEIPDDNNWHSVEVRWVGTQDTSGWIYIQPGRNVDDTVIQDIRTGYGAGIQLEAKPYSTSFTIGTRAPERLEIPTEGVINPEEGQIDLDIANFFVLNRASGYIYSTRTSGGNINLYMLSASSIRLAFGGHSGNRTITPYFDGKPHRITLKYSRTDGEVLLIDGNVEINRPDSTDYDLSNLGEYLYLGSRFNGTNHSNIEINGFRIRSKAMTDQQIADEFEQGPLRPDQLTTYFLPFNGDLDTSQMVKRVPRWRGYSGVTM